MSANPCIGRSRSTGGLPRVLEGLWVGTRPGVPYTSCGKQGAVRCTSFVQARSSNCTPTAGRATLRRSSERHRMSSNKGGRPCPALSSPGPGWRWSAPTGFSPLAVCNTTAGGARASTQRGCVRARPRGAVGDASSCNHLPQAAGGSKAYQWYGHAPGQTALQSERVKRVITTRRMVICPIPLLCKRRLRSTLRRSVVISLF